MRKLFIMIGVLVLAACLTTAAFAGGNSKVAYTWTAADLGQGVWGGGLWGRHLQPGHCRTSLSGDFNTAPGWDGGAFPGSQLTGDIGPVVSVASALLIILNVGFFAITKARFQRTGLIFNE